MAKPQLIPFRAEHLLEIVSRDPFDDLLIDDAWRKESSGPAFTAHVYEKIIACAGVMLLRPGVGFAWTVFSHDVIDHKVWITRTIRAALRDIIKGCRLHRVEANVLERETTYRRWIETFGFEVEGIAHDYTSDQQNMARYEWVRDQILVKQVGDMSKNAQIRQFIAMIGNIEVGYATHGYTPEEHYAYGLQCKVEPMYRNRGVGSALHKARLESAKRDGAPFFVGQTTNPAMMRILRKFGARRCENELGVTYVVKL